MKLRCTVLSFLLTTGLAQSVVAADIGKPATDATKAANAAVLKELPFSNKQAFEDSKKGFIAPLENNGVVKNAKGDIVWDLPKFNFLSGDKPAPDTVNPSLWRQAQIMQHYTGLFKVTEGIYQVRGLDISNITFIEAPEGVIVMDPLVSAEVAKVGLELYRKHRGNKPVVAVIHSHSHIDHYGGVKGVVSQEDIDSGKVKVYAPTGFTEAALNENVIGGNRQTRLSGYQYSQLVEPGPTGSVTSGLGLINSRGTITFAVPTNVITKPVQKETIAGLEFEFMLAPDTEAPAEMFFYIPKYKALSTAEDAVHTQHNVYSLRGAKVRSAYNWAKYLKLANERWGNQAEVLYAPHHWPIWDKERISEHLVRQSAAYKYINDQSVRLANSGYDMVEAAEMLQLPKELQSEWGLRGYYGTTNHNVKAAVDKHFGWFNGNPATLHPLPRVEAAKKYVDYMGGADAILTKAKADFDQGDYRWVMQVLMQVVYADPGNMKARNLMADASEQLGYQAEAGTWRGWYMSAAKDLREGVKPMPIAVFASPDTVAAMPLELFFDYLSIRLNGPKAEGKTIKMNLDLPDTKDKYLLVVQYGVLQYHKDQQAKDADASLTMSRDTLNEIIGGKLKVEQGITKGAIKLQGDPQKFEEFVSLLDTFDPWYQVVMPMGTK
ncbi:alkyl/aryl-sulfatase [Microbulbifer pacificus]|uniref:Alkyl sulfatase dimerization domain-containing protein n=1 Tax=Microbulbifer pacificus TaxID=407164 RepID=A0AAU0N2C9_9GAMM|nr:alkyl sulfatase dimerization domain-containing protein [Microbulbifer pacificus]WOX06647.1 alkyl sulfatase dimerization domain-containing protein [Microbulbifer pacificus]